MIVVAINSARKVRLDPYACLITFDPRVTVKSSLHGNNPKIVQNKIIIR